MGITTDRMQELIEEFRNRGFVVLQDALSPQQVKEFSQAVDRYLERFPPETDHWVKQGHTSIQALDVLPRTTDFDSAVENPVTLGFARSYFGEEVTFEHLSLLIRRPVSQPSEFKGWHRDNSRNYDLRKEIGAISVIFYLTDVAENDHRFSIVPETHNRLIDIRPEDVRPGDEVDITGPAGTAIIFHARCIHSGKVKENSRERRTLHLYYWDTRHPRTSVTSTIPRRLYEKAEKADPALPPKLYSKWNVTETLDIIGKRRY